MGFRSRELSDTAKMFLPYFQRCERGTWRDMRLLSVASLTSRSKMSLNNLVGHIAELVSYIMSHLNTVGLPLQMPPSKQLGGSEALTCLYVHLHFFRNKCSGNAPQKFEGYDINPEKLIVGDTRLHYNNK